MKCESCGAPVENGVCTYCGKKYELLKEEAQVQPQTINNIANNQTNITGKETPQKNNKKLTICKTCGAEIAKGVKKCPSCGAKQKKPIWKKWWFWLIIVCLIFGVSSGGSDTGDKEISNNTVIENKVEDTKESNTTQQTETKQESQQAEIKSNDNVSTEFKNALKKAENYSKIMHMSKKGIYDQLTSEYGEGFPVDAAQYAIDNLNANYNANALAKAKSYSDTMSMSKKGIYDQLISEYGEQFTADEAQYAVDNLNADYKANALAKAKSYSSMMNMSKSAIYDQLISEYGEQFTEDEAQYAVDNLD